MVIRYFLINNRKVKKMQYQYHDGNRTVDYPRKRKGADCVVRSISIILNQPYKTTLKDLCDYAVQFGAIPNEDWLYEKYLLDKGFENNFIKIISFYEMEEKYNCVTLNLRVVVYYELEVI